MLGTVLEIDATCNIESNIEMKPYQTFTQHETVDSFGIPENN